MQYAWLILSPFLPKKSQIIPLRLIIPSPSHQPHPTSLRVQTNGTESQEHQQQRPPSLLPLLMGRCDVPEARKGAEDKETPLSPYLSLSFSALERRGERKRRKKSVLLLLLRRFFIRQLLEVARKKRAKYPPLNAESTQSRFLNEKGGVEYGERWGKAGGEREIGGGRGGSWPRDRRPIHRATAPRPAFRDIKGRHGSTCIGARRDAGVVDTRAVNLACTPGVREVWTILRIYACVRLGENIGTRREMIEGFEFVSTSRIKEVISFIIWTVNLILPIDENWNWIFQNSPCFTRILLDTTDSKKL